MTKSLIKILDWGLASSASQTTGDDSLTDTSIVGTADYLVAGASPQRQLGGHS